jgi:hypothetical protein
MLTKYFPHQWKNHTPPLPMDVLLPFPFAFAKLLLEFFTTIFKVVITFGANEGCEHLWITHLLYFTPVIKFLYEIV